MVRCLACLWAWEYELFLCAVKIGNLSGSIVLLLPAKQNVCFCSEHKLEMICRRASFLRGDHGDNVCSGYKTCGGVDRHELMFEPENFSTCPFKTGVREMGADTFDAANVT